MCVFTCIYIVAHIMYSSERMKKSAWEHTAKIACRHARTHSEKPSWCGGHYTARRDSCWPIRHWCEMTLNHGRANESWAHALRHRWASAQTYFSHTEDLADDWKHLWATENLYFRCRCNRKQQKKKCCFEINKSAWTRTAGLQLIVAT